MRLLLCLLLLTACGSVVEPLPHTPPSCTKNFLVWTDPLTGITYTFTAFLPDSSCPPPR